MAEKLYQLLVNSANQFPDKIAVEEAGGQSVSYADLLQLVQSRMELLLTKDLVDSKIIGVLGSKSIETLSLIFSIAGANKAYLPLDFNSPLSRIQKIISVAQIKFIFSDLSRKNDLESLGYNLYSAINSNWALFRNELVCEREVHTDLAYVLFTSGTTGIPKGVCVSDRAAFDFIHWATDQLELNAQHVFSSVAPFHFDLSVFDIFASVKSGAKLILFNSLQIAQPAFLVDTIKKHSISVWYSTPTTLRLMVEFGNYTQESSASLQHIIFAGESYPSSEFVKLQHNSTNKARFYNWYGPTETNVCTSFSVPQGNWNPEQALPIGRATRQYESKISDGDIEGTSQGELLMSGTSLMNGYLNNEQANQHAFVFIDGKKWYKTGDLVEWQSGELVFKGRYDRMIKRNGYRIELNEIEVGLQSCAGLLFAAVVAVHLPESVKIAAFVSGINESDLIALRAELMKVLPAYMIPDKFIILDNIPLNSSQKTDYQALIHYAAEHFK